MSDRLPKSIEEYIGSKHNDFNNALKTDETIWHNIPLLNYTPLHKLNDLCLVRYRGMIQDMRDNEMYLERYEVRNKITGEVRMYNGKYRDCLNLKENESVNYDEKTIIHGERKILYVTLIPALNKWCVEYEKKINNENPSLVGSIIGDSKEAKMSSTEKELFPELKESCLIKVYEDYDDYRLNDIIDVVGFLSIHPNLHGALMTTEYDNPIEMEAQNPNPQLTPRLHAIAINKLSHSNPLIDKHLQQQFPVTTYNETSAMNDYTELRTLLKLCCLNDDIAAEYILCHLISKVYNRVDDKSVGKFCVNIWNFPNEIKQYAEDFYNILNQIVPASIYIPMTLQNINTSDFIPKKNYETNTLVTGLLQLAPHTHLILDETKLEQGKLDSQGVQNLHSVSNMIRNQQIQCNFQYYNVNYDVDILVLIFSEGVSILPCDVSLPLKIDADSLKIKTEIFKAAQHYLLQNNRLHRFRCYITQCTLIDYQINQDAAKFFEQDYAEMRKVNHRISPDDLHNLLVISRLLAISRGKRAFDKELWKLAKDMESKRHQRFNVFPKAQNINSLL